MFQNSKVFIRFENISKIKFETSTETPDSHLQFNLTKLIILVNFMNITQKENLKFTLYMKFKLYFLFLKLNPPISYGQDLKIIA